MKVSWRRGPVSATVAPYGLPGLIRAQAKRRPDEIAIVDRGMQLTYGELESLSDCVARALRERTRPGDRIAVSVPRGWQLLPALLGALKAQRPYLPLDPFEPLRRRIRIAEVAEPALCLVGGPDGAPPPGVPGLDLTELLAVPPPTGPLDALEPVIDHLPVSVLFTSGSTGEPKGVVVGSAALCNRLTWMRAAYTVTSADRILQKTPLGFDVAGWELFLPLISGAVCVMAGPGEHRDPDAVAELILREKITICHFVPSMLEEFLRGPLALDCTCLREVFCSGEALPSDLARRCVAMLPARLHNLYGPTEAAIDVTFWPVPPRPDLISKVFIGTPIDNCEVAVVDGESRPSEQGELLVGGLCLAEGYFARPDLTARAFVSFADGPLAGRWYRTGDLVRVVDGNLEFLGRADEQVKIRGHRIEPQEVETALRALDGVADAVVVGAVLDGRPELVAFVVPELPSPAGLGRLLRQQLLDDLPAPYVPNRIECVMELPRTISGKVDRRCLQLRAQDA